MLTTVEDVWWCVLDKPSTMCPTTTCTPLQDPWTAKPEITCTTDINVEPAQQTLTPEEEDIPTAGDVLLGHDRGLDRAPAIKYDARLDTTCQVPPVVDVGQTLTAVMEPIVVRDVLKGKYRLPDQDHHATANTVADAVAEKESNEN